MRKILSISLGLLYALLSLGIHIHLHYCQDEMADVSFFGELESCCATEEDHGCEFSHECCDFQDVELTIEEAHQPVKKIGFDHFAIQEKIQPQFFSVEQKEEKTPTNVEPLRGPPEPLYLLNCSFTFYG